MSGANDTGANSATEAAEPNAAAQPGPDQPDRRAFLSSTGAAGLAGLAGLTLAGCTAAEPESPAAATADEPTVAPTQTPPRAPTETAATTSPQQTQAAVFRSARQPGVLLPRTPAGIFASFDVTASDRDALATTLQRLSNEIERLMTGEPVAQSDPIRPPDDSGLLGDDPGPTGTVITVAVGASLFDDRFGLANQRPAELISMPLFFNDRLVQLDLSHGDIGVIIHADSQQAAARALHQIVRVTERRLALRWVQEGFNEILPPDPDHIASTRNLMGFRDGTSNPDKGDDAAMNDHVWIQGDDDEPAWAVDGTYLAARVIRMLIEFWATAALVRQEQIFGRHRESGAPLGQSLETEDPVFAATRDDQGVPPGSHIARANLGDGEPRILRSGFSYLNGVDSAGELDQGLLFLAYQRSLRTGFLAVQERLNGEPLEDYIKPVGGGLFFVLPGPGTAQDGYLGQSLMG